MTKKILGTSKVAIKSKISLIKDVAEKMNAKVGDVIVFYEENGKIIIEKA